MLVFHPELMNTVSPPDAHSEEEEGSTDQSIGRTTSVRSR